MVSIYEMDDNYVKYLRKYDNNIWYSKAGDRKRFNQSFWHFLCCDIIYCWFLFFIFYFMSVRNMREKDIIDVKCFKSDLIRN